MTTVSKTRTTVGSSPVAVLELQGWLDDHGLTFDLYAHFGTAIQQLNNQVANILSQAVRIILTAGNLLVNTVLALIISIYFLSDGRRLIRKGIAAAPASQRENAEFFVHSLDRVMGSYLRGELLLAGLAGLLGGVGAWTLGVPYPVLIGVSTFFLSLVPVIGAVILIVPPVAIALLFTSFTTAIILLVYFLVFMQIVTNIIGPRVMGSAVGIHPLEAMAAALVGFPLAGFLGSFFAVPIVGFLHILIKEIHRHFLVAGRRDDLPPGPQASSPSPASTPVPAPAASGTAAE